MPTAYIKKLAEEGHGSEAELEKKWDDAKAQAAKQGHGKDYDYITSIFQKMAHVKSSSLAHRIWSKVIKAFSPQGQNLQHSVPGADGNGFELNADTAYMDSLVDSGKFTRDEVDQAWEKAGKIANANKAKDNDIVVSYAYITTIFQGLLGIKNTENAGTGTFGPALPVGASFKLKAAARLKAMDVKPDA